jgi:four helix bundle protein
MSEIQSYRDLIVCQRAMALVKLSYQFSARHPRNELYGLTAQLRRASVSVPANIAEGFGRENTGSFIQHLRIAQGSLKELETHILLSVSLDFTISADAQPLLVECEVVGKLLRALIRSLQAREAKRNSASG